MSRSDRRNSRALSRRRRVLPALLLFLLLSVLACMPAEAAAYKPVVKNETVKIKGLKSTSKILFVTDMHIIANNDSAITKKTRSTYKSRLKQMTFSYGTTGKGWLRLASKLDSYNADLIIFGGDMIDYCSKANLKLFQQGLNKIQTPYIVLYGNHETYKWAQGDSKKKVASVIADSEIYSESTVITREMPGFHLLCLNDKETKVSEATVTQTRAKLKKWGTKKPVIVFTHVPVVCGEHANSDNAHALTSLLFAKTSPVKAVFTGHVHHYQILYYRKGLNQVSLLPAYSQYITMVTVTGTGSDN